MGFSPTLARPRCSSPPPTSTTSSLPFGFGFGRDGLLYAGSNFFVRSSTLHPVFLLPATLPPYSHLLSFLGHLPRSLLSAPTRSRPQRFSQPSSVLLAQNQLFPPLLSSFRLALSFTSSHSLNRSHWPPGRTAMLLALPCAIDSTATATSRRLT